MKEKQLPEGESKCLNTTCPLSNECLRRLAPDNKSYQSFEFFSPADSVSCEHLIKAFVTDEF